MLSDGQKLKKMRLRLALTQSELAYLLTRLTGTLVAQTRINRWELGKNKVVFPKLIFKALIDHDGIAELKTDL